MAKGKKKKKKDLDFQKVKLKVGRKLKRDSNETRAEFQTRKIILKEVKSHSSDPLTAIINHSDHISHQGKLAILKHFNAALTPEISKSLNRPILNSLAKFLVDQSDDVRKTTIKCLRTCYNHLKQIRSPVKDFLYSIKPYLDCAYTHLDRGIATDCHNFLLYLVNVNDEFIYEPLMHIILRRYETGNLTQPEKKLACKLKQQYLRFKQKQSIEEQLQGDKLEPLIWTPTNYMLDLDNVIHDLDYERTNMDHEIYVQAKAKVENIAEKYVKQIPDNVGDTSFSESS